MGICYRWDVVAVGLSTFVWSQSQHSACPWVRNCCQIKEQLKYLQLWRMESWIKNNAVIRRPDSAGLHKKKVLRNWKWVKIRIQKSEIGKLLLFYVPIILHPAGMGKIKLLAYFWNRFNFSFLYYVWPPLPSVQQVAALSLSKMHFLKYKLIRRKSDLFFRVVNSKP